RQIFTFNDLDHQKDVSDLLGLRQEFEPRADGLVTKVTNARGNATAMEHTALGEIEKVVRADGMEVRYRHDAQRQTTYQGDPDAGFEFDYDNSLRLAGRTQRDGARTVYEGFDPRNMPQSITLPGGTETRKYDLLQRMTERKLAYQGRTIEEQYTYDGLDRVREVAYGTIGGATNVARYDYDPAGPLVAMHYLEDNRQFEVTYGLYPDGSRRTVTYPSGIEVTEERDVTGRLTGVSDANGTIVRARSWQGNMQPREIDIGAAMEMLCQYDERGRVTATRVARKSDGEVLAHFRFQYDAANNLEIREWVHRGGKADVFTYDAGERVERARIGMLLTNAAGFGPVLYERQYTYDGDGKDLLTSAGLIAAGLSIPPFATNWAGHDAFLQPRIVSGFTRGPPDPRGNVAAAQLWTRPTGGTAAQAVDATLEHDGLGRLTRLQRADGVIVENGFQPGGLRFARRITDNGLVTDRRAFVYDDAGRLLEEYDRTVTPPVLLGRYFYATADGPVAADLRDAGGVLQRHYFLTDPSLSVVAVANAAGEVVERIWYDTFGQPSIEQRDERAPVVNQVISGAGGALLVALSEPVQSAWTDPGPGTGIVVFTNTIGNALSLVRQDNGDPVDGNVNLLADLPGFAPSSVLRFTPGEAADGTVTLTLHAGSVSDEWGNTNVARSITVTNSAAPGTVLFRAPAQVDTSPVKLARSSVGSPFLFHGQYFDYATGLLYLRARFYDPYSGMFLEPDPLGYADSVNHYAGMANNPVGLRDPTGLNTRSYGDVPHGQVKILRDHGYSHSELSLYSRARPKLKELGMGDMEIAAHVRVMYREHMEGLNWELGIRSFDEKAAVRRDRIEEFHQSKEERVYSKTQENGLAEHEGRSFAGDLDGLYAKVNGQIARLDMLQRFQDEVNREVADLSVSWRLAAGAEGRPIKGDQIQKAYQHGFSLNIPQEFGTPHALSPEHAGTGERTFGHWAVSEINAKMKKGIGNAFSFTFDPGGLRIKDSVDVDMALKEHVRHYHNVMFNPAARGRGFEERIYNRRMEQIQRDGGVERALYPYPFYIPNVK
ncbi:MAG TPA: hypothetical protein DCY13_24905, partial [Verrucomicrobiales bacterium]|nr:hypothetical protein [Verrucomicrobiales bacterium]